MLTWYETVAKALYASLDPSLTVCSPLASSGESIPVKIGKSAGDFLVLDVEDPQEAALILGFAQASGKPFLIAVPAQASHHLLDKGLYIYTTSEESGRIFASTVKLTDVEGMMSFMPSEEEPEMTNREHHGEHMKNLELVQVSKSEGEERIASGIVYEPDTLDAHGDFMTEASIRDMAFYYMEKGKIIGLQHQKDASKDVVVLESYLTPFEGVLEGRKIKKGTWMMTVRVNNAKIWQMVKSGQLTGFSFGAAAGIIQH